MYEVIIDVKDGLMMTILLRVGFALGTTLVFIIFSEKYLASDGWSSSLVLLSWLVLTISIISFALMVFLQRQLDNFNNILGNYASIFPPDTDREKYRN